MPNKYLIVAVHMIDQRDQHSLTIRAGLGTSADLLAAQAVAAFCADHAGFSPVAVATAEVSLETLEHAVALLKGEALAEIPRQRGRRRRLQPGMIPKQQEPVSKDELLAVEEYLNQKFIGQPAWGKSRTEEPEPEPGPAL